MKWANIQRCFCTRRCLFSFSMIQADCYLLAIRTMCTIHTNSYRQQSIQWKISSRIFLHACTHAVFFRGIITFCLLNDFDVGEGASSLCIHNITNNYNLFDSVGEWESTCSLLSSQFIVLWYVLTCVRITRFSTHKQGDYDNALWNITMFMLMFNMWFYLFTFSRCVCLIRASEVPRHVLNFCMKSSYCVHATQRIIWINRWH